MARPAHWLDDLVTEVTRAGRATIVCRTSATQREVLRALAAGDGAAAWPGLEVVTLRGLVASRATEPLLGGDAPALALPAGHPWKDLLASRPGLLRLLRAHVTRAQSVVAAGVRVDALRGELAVLAKAWPPPPELDAALALAAHPPDGAVFAVGFHPRFTFGGSVTPLDAMVLDRLRPEPLPRAEPDVAAAGALTALGVPDVAAEARTIAARAAGAAGAGLSVLVLVASSETADRVHAALARNGVAVADDDAIPLRRHALAAALAPLLPAFASRGAEPVDARDLVRLLTDPVLARTAPAGAALAPVPGLDGEPRASTRHVRELLQACHRARATVPEWAAAVAEQERDASERLAGVRDGDPRVTAARAAKVASARVLVAQVRALESRVGASGRLADVAALVSDLGLSAADDRLGRAIQGALRDEGFRPATAEELEDALSGAVGSRRVDSGVQVLSCGSYDGRTAGLLLLADLHDRGIARAPSPDPFLRDDDLAALGYPLPRAAVEERLAVARWAVERVVAAGGTALGVVSRADASGRRVSPPIGLALALTEQEDAFGLGMALPERRDREALAAGAGTPDALATQVDAEWSRAGVAFEAARAGIPPRRPDDTLAEQLARDLPRLPDDLRPWLGGSGPHPSSGDGLPPGFGLSATRLRAFTTCLFGAFCESVLSLDVFEDPAEDLDPREVGSAVHLALQRALPGVKLLVPDEKLAARREAVLARLRKETEKAVKQIAAERDAPETEPLRLAREGLTARWSAHWERFVSTRILPVDAANARVRKQVAGALQTSSATTALAALLAPSIGNKSDRNGLPRSLGSLAFETRCDRAAFVAALPAACASAAKTQAALAARSGAPDVAAAIDAFLAGARPQVDGQGFHPDGDLEVVATELSFGDMPLEDGSGARAAAITLRLGRGDVPVRGRIDAVLRRRGPDAATGSRVEVRDFKTGGRGGAVEKGEQAPLLTRPQTALYALVAEALPGAPGAPAPRTVEALTLDHVVGEDGVKTDRLPAGGTDRIAAALGVVLDRARDGLYPPTPHPLGCPRLRARGAYCDYGDVCRVRNGYAPEDGDEEEVA